MRRALRIIWGHSLSLYIQTFSLIWQRPLLLYHLPWRRGAGRGGAAFLTPLAAIPPARGLQELWSGSCSSTPGPQSSLPRGGGWSPWSPSRWRAACTSRLWGPNLYSLLSLKVLVMLNEHLHCPRVCDTCRGRQTAKSRMWGVLWENDPVYLLRGWRKRKEVGLFDN